MASKLQRTHRILNINRHGQRRRNREMAFQGWISEVHPGTSFEASIPTGYLASLYPNIWRWGPRGDIYVTQLAHIEVLLEQMANGSAYFDFESDFEAVFSGTVSSNYLFENEQITDALNQHAATGGLPLPGDEIMGWDPAQPDVVPPTEDLANHRLCLSRDMGTIPFYEFLYKFSLISIHRTFYLNPRWDQVRIQLALGDYDDFCARWDIPA